MSEAAIQAEGLVKIYRTRKQEVRAVDGVDLLVPRATVMGLLGPNGAGKTTVVRMLTTLLEPDGGSATVGGYDLRRKPHDVRRVVGLSGQYAAVDDYLTGRENLEVIGRLYHLGNAKSKERAQELLERFDLVESADRQVREYSGGMRRRLDLAGALVAQPPVVFLDEPTTGLDPRSRMALWEVIGELIREGTTFLLSTQYLEEADRLADTIAVIDRGKVIARGTSDELKAQVGGERLEVTVAKSESLAVAKQVLAELANAEPEVDEHGRHLVVPIHGGANALIELVRRFDTAGIGLHDIGLRRPTLDDVFLTLTGHHSESNNEDAEQGVPVEAVR